ncbi:hypothetical protein DENSPDRAFT_930823 [Dentipellis sp. KUC8613]|nr:hypothetical protein DENSPDRAFT_930823 [Dentipellis sp. KUC8613]
MDPAQAVCPVEHGSANAIPVMPTNVSAAPSMAPTTHLRSERRDWMSSERAKWRSRSIPVISFPVSFPCVVVPCSSKVVVVIPENEALLNTIMAAQRRTRTAGESSIYEDVCKAAGDFKLWGCVVEDVNALRATYAEAVDVIERCQRGAGRGDEEVADTVGQRALGDRMALEQERLLGCEQKDLNATMNGEPVRVSRFAASLRRKLYRQRKEHTTSFKRAEPVPNDDEFDDDDDRLITDPLLEESSSCGTRLRGATARSSRSYSAPCRRTSWGTGKRMRCTYAPKVKTGHVVPGIPLERVLDALVEAPFDLPIDQRLPTGSSSTRRCQSIYEA